MRLWRLTRAPFVALDGKGAELFGGRYSPPGVPVVPLASEAGLAVLIALRYLPRDPNGIADDHVLGWTEIEDRPERFDEADEEAVRGFVAKWLGASRSLALAIPSRVLPEADVVLLNPAHPGMAGVAPLTVRPFDFSQCLHVPPMLSRFGE